MEDFKKHTLNNKNSSKVILWIFFLLFERERGNFSSSHMYKDTFEALPVSGGSTARVIDFEMVFGYFHEFRRYFFNTYWKTEPQKPVSSKQNF